MTDNELLINREVGIEFCGGMEELYDEVIGDYVQDSEERKSKLTSFYNSKDWKNYAIEAHALKTTSKTIGAENFAEHCRKHEFAGKEDDSAYIEGDFNEFMEQFDALVSSLR